MATRRAWTQREEEVLIQCLKEIIAEGWKADNGFRVGYLTQLENGMKKAFPTTDLKALPHINSKVHDWKKNYGSLFCMLPKSGIGWNPTLKMIEATNEAFLAAKKVDKNVHNMRYKNWPFYEDRCDIFSKDRATGDQAKDVMDTVNELLMAAKNKEQENTANFNTYTVKLEEDARDVSFTQCASGSGVKKGKGKKRKSMDGPNNNIVDALNSFLNKSDSRMGEITSHIGYEYDAMSSRIELYQIMDNINGLSLQVKLRVSDELVQNTEQLEFYLSLPEGAREEYVRLLLAKGL